MRSLRMIDPATRRSLQCAGLALSLAMSVSVADARKAPPPEPDKDRPTSRMVVERQLDAHSTAAGASTTGAEVRRIEDRYLSRIGVQLEVRDTSQSGHSN
jgi:hypothetical protein